MCGWLKSVHNGLRNAGMAFDYGLYLAFSPFKFKPFPKEIKKILVVETLRIGDLLVITPALRALKETFKGASIDLLVSKGMEEILERNKNINKVLVDDIYLMDKLRRERYDLGVIFHDGSLRMSLALLKGNVRYRVGCTSDIGLLSGKGWFLNKKVPPIFSKQHKRDDNLVVVRSIGAATKNKKLEIHATKEAEQKINQFLQNNKIKKSEKIFIMHVASKHKAQRWVNERWARLIEKISQKKGARIILTGAKEDSAQIDTILSQTKVDVINGVGKTTFKEYVALINKAHLVITVDTSATHIASALKKPIVVLFGPTYPERWGPTGTKAIVIKNKQTTMKSIMVEQVWKAVKGCL